MNKIVFFLLVFFSLVATVKGQDGNNTKYFLENLPGRIRLNPAYQPEYKTYIGLPGLGGISLNYNNSGFHAKSLLRKGELDSVYFNINRFHKGLNRRNFIMVNNDNVLLTLGFRARNGWYWSVDVAEKNDFMVSFNRNIFTFVKNGNTDYLGSSYDLGPIGLKGSMYTEFAFGLSKKVNQKLTVGGRVKFLRGIANIDTKDSDMSVYTSADGGNVRLTSVQNVRVSAPIRYVYDKDGFVDWDGIELNDDKLVSSLLSTRNIGFAMDFGGEYQLLDKLKLHASLLDLGFIKWGSNTYSFYQNTTFDWNGGDLSNSINSQQPDYRKVSDVFGDLADSLKNSFRFNDVQDKYTTMLHAKLYLGATYEMSKMLNFGGVFKASMYDGFVYPSLTVSANSRLHRNVGASLTYTTMFGNYVNLGLGLTAKLGPLQLFLVTDNMLAANFTHTKTVNFSFGINILTGHKDYRPGERKKRPVRSRTDIQMTNTPTGNMYTVKKKVGNQWTSMVVTNELEQRRDTLQKWDTIYRRDTIVVVQPEARKQADSVASVSKNISYSVIVGSFAKERGALQVQKDFIRKGYGAAHIIKNDMGLFQVCVASFGNEAQAREVLGEVRGKYPKNNDVWVREIEL